MQSFNNRRPSDFVPLPDVIHLTSEALCNTNFRKEIFTGCHLQATLMCIPPRCDIGAEVHENVDQLLFIVQGQGVAVLGTSRCQPQKQCRVRGGDAIFVPAGTWHNVINTARMPMKLVSVYAPPNHPVGTLQRTKADAAREEY